MSNEMLMASGYALAWIAILGACAYVGLKVSRAEQPQRVKISADELYERSRNR